MVGSTPTTWTPEHQPHGAGGLGQGLARGHDEAHRLSGTMCAHSGQEDSGVRSCSSGPRVRAKQLNKMMTMLIPTALSQ